MPNWLSQIIDVLSLRGLAGPSSIQGCTETEIAEIANNATLPRCYLEFLSTMGRSAGRFFNGTDIFYPRIVGMTDDAALLVSEDAAGIALPDDAFAFAMHQGYEVLFFRTSEGDDPPIYYYLEGSGHFEKKYRSLTEYLVVAAKGDW